MKNLFTSHKEELKDLLRYGVLKAEVLENPGLYNGRLGMTILFYEYSRYCDDPLYEQFADEIMDSVLELPNVSQFLERIIRYRMGNGLFTKKRIYRRKYG